MSDVTGVTAVTTLPDGRVQLDLQDGRTAHVTVRRTDRPSPTRLTCKGKEGLAYPEFDVLDIDVVERSPRARESRLELGRERASR